MRSLTFRGNGIVTRTSPFWTRFRESIACLRLSGKRLRYRTQFEHGWDPSTKPSAKGCSRGAPRHTSESRRAPSRRSAFAVRRHFKSFDTPWLIGLISRPCLSLMSRSEPSIEMPVTMRLPFGRTRRTSDGNRTIAVKSRIHCFSSCFPLIRQIWTFRIAIGDATWLPSERRRAKTYRSSASLPRPSAPCRYVP